MDRSNYGRQGFWSDEEPDWIKYLDIVKVQPVSKRFTGIEKAKGTNDLLATIILQQENQRGGMV